MKLNTILVGLIIVLLLVVDWLTFHDFSEAHTARDWLTLFSSILVFGYLAKELLRR